MKGVQIILLLMLLMIFIYVITRLRSRKLDIILAALLIFTGAVMVLKPEWTIFLANKLGVGRGSDLVFYISILLFWFIILKIYARLRRLEQTVTDLIRKDALDEKESSGK